MKYLIHKKVVGANYYLKLDSGYKPGVPLTIHKCYEWQGLITNATVFESEHETGPSNSETDRIYVEIQLLEKHSLTFVEID